MSAATRPLTGTAPSGCPGSTALARRIIAGGCRPSQEERLSVTPSIRQPEQARPQAVAAVVSALSSRGAARIAHPGGTLLAHLERVGALLDQWGARPTVRSAGRCHAWYGTDGFEAALGDVTNRDELAVLIGADAEQLVYFYASCDRRFSYPQLAERDGLFRDRFTGTVLCPPTTTRRDLAELTAANELDIMVVNPSSRANHGAQLLELFTSWKNLLSNAAWQAIQTSLSTSAT
jgi:hypothetical protein